MTLAGYKPLYISLFQLIDLLHMNKMLNINLFSLSQEKKKDHAHALSQVMF